MSTDTSTTEQDSTEAEKPVYEKGTWQEEMQRSTVLLDRSTKARKTASNLLWHGATTAIEEWLPNGEDDVSGENLYNEVLDILGKPRKGDASKIKTVAVAVKDHGLVLTAHPNLSKAYAEAVRLTKTQAAQAAEDDAAEKAVEAIEAPSSTTTVEGAARLLLSKGIDGAVVAILDALGATNFEAHRSFVRATTTEVAARVQAAKPKPVKKAATPKGKATPAKKATPKSGATKAKPTTKAKPKAKATTSAALEQATVADTGGKPEAVTEPVEAGTEHMETPEVPVATKGKAKPVVVKR